MNRFLFKSRCAHAIALGLALSGFTDMALAQTASATPPAALPARPEQLLVGTAASHPGSEPASRILANKRNLNLKDQSLTLRLPVAPVAKEPLERVGRKDALGTSLKLVLDGFSASVGSDAIPTYDIYLNLPSTSEPATAKGVDASAFQAHRVGSIGPQDLILQSQQGSKVFDIGKLIAALKASGDWNPEGVEVNFVKADTSLPSSSHLTITNVRLTTTQDK